MIDSDVNRRIPVLVLNNPSAERLIHKKNQMAGQKVHELYKWRYVFKMSTS